MLNKIAYAAGLIDGEGWIGVRTHNRSRTYTPAIAVNMIDPEGLELLRDLFGGSLKLHDRTRYGVNNKDMFTWELAGNTCLSTLDKLYPFLLIKKSRIDVIKKSTWTPYNRQNNIPDEERQLRKSIYEELRVK